LAEIDLPALRDAAAADVARHLSGADGRIDVVNGYARPVAAHTAQRLFGIGAGLEPVLFMDVARAIFAHTFLNLSDDADVAARALRAGGLMRRWFEAEIARRHAMSEYGSDMMGALLRNRWLDDDAVRRTLGGMLVGSIDTTASAVAKIVATIAGSATLSARVEADLDCPERLAGWCREALRRWPHNPIVIRRAAVDTVFNTVEVKRGDTVIAWTQAAMLDPTVFPRPALLRPDRPSGTYMHFGGGLHPCAGRAVNAFQIPLLVGALLRRGIASAEPMEWAGPFPDRLVIKLRGVAP
jgi:cytochrome P450